jgi:hypothetical protein
MTAAPNAIREYAAIRAAALVALRSVRGGRADLTEGDPEPWLTTVFSGYIRMPFAPYQSAFWRWVWSINAGESAPPFVAIWPRGFGKSTSTEIACAAVAARETRTYGLYVSNTQAQADTHVQNVAGLLEGNVFGAHYPRAARRRVGKYGNSQGWRRNRLRTESGFTLDAIGLDTAARGAKVDEDRPDFIIFDDIDDVLDAPATVNRKIKTLTQSLIPARAPHAAILVCQNLIHQDGIVAQLADGRAAFLADRIVSGPHPAARNLVIEQRGGKAMIVSGEPTWPVMDLPALQADLNEMGETAFQREKQHEVDHLAGSIFEHVGYRHCAWDDVPTLERIVVWVDPAVTDTEQSDAHGIQADGLASNGDIYRLYSWENRTSPEDALRRAILKAIELKAECVGVETDQGGDAWESVYWRVVTTLRDAGDLALDAYVPAFRQAKAGQGHGPKAHRASQMLVDYERGKVIHVIGAHETLERALKRYLVRKPYDLVDAGYWSWADLRGLREPDEAQSVLVLGGATGWGYEGGGRRRR